MILLSALKCSVPVSVCLWSIRTLCGARQQKALIYPASLFGTSQTVLRFQIFLAQSNNMFTLITIVNCEYFFFIILVLDITVEKTQLRNFVQIMQCMLIYTRFVLLFEMFSLSSPMEWSESHVIQLCRDMMVTIPFSAKRETSDRKGLWETIAGNLVIN